MNTTPIEEIYNSIRGLTAKTMHLEARCDALEIACNILARKTGIAPDRILAVIDQTTQACFQKRLERAESSNPALAAELDYRPPIPDLPSDML